VTTSTSPRRALAALAVGAVFLLAGCGDDDTDADTGGGTADETADGTDGGTVVVRVDDPAAPVDATVGQEIHVPLASNPTTGYAWQVVDAGDPAVVAFVTSDYEADQPVLEGSGGVETLVFQAVGEGETTVSLGYAFEGDDPASESTDEVVLTIVVAG
jgi:inhibitor of cysteine peptidase